MPLFLKAKRNAKIATVVGVVTSVTAIAGGLMAIQSINNDGLIINEQRYNTGTTILFSSALVSMAVNIPLRTKSRRQLDDAIWLRNRALFGE